MLTWVGPVLTLVLSNMQGAQVDIGVGPPSAGQHVQVHLPEQLTDKDIQQLLGPHAGAKLLHFSNVTAVFRGFTDTAVQQNFLKRLRHLPGFWCCRQVPEGEDGGVPYRLVPADDSTFMLAT